MNFRRLAVLLTGTTLLVAACGTAEVVAPRVALREAASATAEQPRMRVTLTLTGSEGDIATLLAGGEAVSPDDEKAAAVLADSRVAFVTDSRSEHFGAEVSVGGVGDAFEIRVLDRTLYARVDVPDVMRLFDADPGQLDEVVAEARRHGMGFVADIVAGRWIRTDLEPLEQLADDVRGAGGGVMPSLPGDEARKLFEAFARTWGEDVAVERLDDDHYRLTVPIRRVFERLLPVLGQLPGFPAGALMPPPDAVPDRTVTAEVWVSDGKITRGELDLTQFSEVKAGRVALRVDLSSPDADIEAPDDAVDVDVADLFRQFLGLAVGEGATAG